MHQLLISREPICYIPSLEVSFSLKSPFHFGPFWTLLPSSLHYRNKATVRGVWKLVKFFQFLYSNDSSPSIIISTRNFIYLITVFSLREEGGHEHEKEEVVLKGSGTQLRGR
jgi:hypothetical protein